MCKVIELGKIFILTIIAGRLLSTEDFGIFSLLLSVAAIVAILAEFRVQDVIYRNINKGGGVSEAVGSSVVIVIFFAAIGHILLISISNLNFFYGSNSNFYYLYGFVFYLSISRVFKTVLMAEERSVLILYIEIVSFVVGALTLLYFYCNQGISINSIIVVRILDLFILTAMTSAAVLTRSGIKMPSKYQVISLVKEAFPLVLSGVAVILYQKVDQLMIKDVMGYDALGLYSANLTIVTIFSILPMMYAQVASKSIHVDCGNLNLIRYLRIISYSGLLLSVFLFVLGGYLVTYIFGTRYQIDSAIWYPLALIPFFISTGAGATQILIAENRQSFVWIKSLIALLVNILLNYFLIPLYGMFGAAAATAFALFVGNIFSNYMIKSYRDIFKIQFKSLLFHW
tara:strand:+ start:178 stop:1374 length:1197 start_codon:yes stop_codon:yes gene_type:complete